MDTNLSREEAQQRSAQLSVSTYEVSVDISKAADPSVLTFPVVSTVTFESKTAETWLDFVGEAVAAVMINGEDRPVEYDGSRIKLTKLSTEQPNRVTVTAEGIYSRSGQGLHRFVDPEDDQTYLYTQFEPADSRRLYPNFEQPDLKATFVITLVGPKDWKLLSNQPEDSRETVDENSVMVTFKPTPKLSTYITCIAAGPYAAFEDHWTGTAGDGTELSIPLASYCRASMAKHFDADEFNLITKQGLEFFNREFKVAYPWGKYDSILVPEYNLGAMENPGLVTFTEHFIFRSAAIRSQFAARANTILHEMSHMWFGDLVTPRWWDDLWLKESFAEFMGADSSAEATEFKDAWVDFGGARKQWAYAEDQRPTTHPIVADITDLEAAKQNFDGITYAKGASVLKQLVAYVGRDAFYEGARRYFERYQYSSTTLGDLLSVLEETSGRDLKEWSARWLETAGVDVMKPIIETSDGIITKLMIEQVSLDPRTSEATKRPHRLGIGLYHVENDKLSRYAYHEIDVMGGGAEVTEVVGEKAPDLVLLNDKDLAYTKVRFDDISLATISSHLSSCEDPLARALMWGALWDMTRDAELPASRFVSIMLSQTVNETDSTLLNQLAANARLALDSYTTADERPAQIVNFENEAWRLMQTSQPGSDIQLVWARTFGRLAASSPQQADRVRSILDGSVAVPGLELSPDLRWIYVRALGAAGELTDAELAAEKARDKTMSGMTAYLGVLAGRPDPAAKQQSWHDLHVPSGMPNDHVDSVIEGFMKPAHATFTDSYAEQYFQNLIDVWAKHPIEISSRLVRGLYPNLVDLEPGQSPDSHPRLVQTETWLADHPDAPAALRRIVIQCHDALRRALRCQAAN